MHMLIRNRTEALGEGWAQPYSTEVIDRLSGRPGIGAYILGTAVRRTGTAYVACNRTGEWAGRGFIVEVVYP